MLAATLKYAQGCQVIAGIERPTTPAVIDFAKRAQHLGATAIMITTPFGSDIEQREMIEHFRAVHDAVSLPIGIYNENALSGNETTFDTLLAIAQLPRVVSIKDSASAPRSLAQVGALRRLGLAYYTGWEQQLTALPANGSVVSLANLEPALCRAVHLCGSPALQVEVDRLAHHYHLDAPDWYRHIKCNLVQRGVIATDRTIVPITEETA
jgi:4-hydroxy-tetrahydrodipicolinate synthase